MSTSLSRGPSSPVGVAPPALRVLLSAVHELPRLGLRALISAHGGLGLVGEGVGEVALAELYARTRPDVVLVDVDCPGQLEVVQRLLQRFPGAVVVALGTHEGDEAIRGALALGVRGYLPKSLPANEIAAGLRAALRRRLSLPVAVSEALAERCHDAPLTAREREVLCLLSDGCSNAAIAGTLAIAVGTVKVHVKAILAKLGAADRTEAIVMAYRRGFVRVP